MPPFISRKRSRSASPAPTPPSKRSKHRSSSSRTKQTLFDAADASTRKHRSAAETHKLLSSLGKDDDDDHDSSSLSDVDSDEFEDVKPAHPLHRHATKAPNSDKDDEDDEDDDDGMDWEDAILASASASTSTHGPRHPPADEIADISVSVHDDGSYVQPLVAMTSNNAGKKGPSKRERQIRVQTHCLHVLTLLWHNTVRNSWLNDAQVQTTLRDALPEGVRREVTRWREAMGMLSKEELAAKKRRAAAKAAKGSGRRKTKGKEGRNSARDWSYAAEHLEQGVPDLSRGDPLLRLLKVLAAYWRKRFVVVAPALRKQGYMTLMRLRDEVKDWNKNRNDAETHGERIENLEAFRKAAAKCEGSRDVGAQLFVALLRVVGLETRMVANLQPAGFGWSKAEEAGEKRPKKGSEKDPAIVDDTSDNSDIDQSPAKPPPAEAKKAPKKQVKKQPDRRSTRGKQTDPINLDDSESSLSSVASEPENSTIQPGEDEDNDNENDDEDDDISVVDVTPITPRRPTKKFDRDLAFPTYWTEVRSPVSNKYIPVDPIVLSTIASNEDLLQTFEPRGKKADKTKQVICYTIAFSADGSAKDVTVRYLKKHQLPGKTKGVRMPIEKVPVYNRNGKVKKYEEYDWFRTVIAMYDRPESKRTAADDLEDRTDLKPYKPAKEDKELEKESLQWYKQSAEFVLEQHLRREEAIVPGAEPVKTFVAGKGDKAKEHPVYRRKDVVPCKTVESWHKEGREIKMGEQPFKYVPMRAVTLIRKREIEDAQRETGEKLKQGLYSREQTDWIIPPPIKNGVIPKNAFGNMDVYVPTMVPKGAVHLRLKGSAKICRKLDVDYAEACTGFEFGKQRAVPILTGVVVAKENAQMVKDAWQTAQEEIQRKEDTKRTGLSLHWWRKMLMGLRIVERMREEYHQNGGTEEETNPFVNKAKREGRNVQLEYSTHEDSGGGFLLPEHEDEGSPSDMHDATREGGYDHQDSGGFLVEDDLEHTGGGGFLVEEDDKNTGKLSPSTKGPMTVTPVSLRSIHNAEEDVLPDVNGDNDSEPSLQLHSHQNGDGEASEIDKSVLRKKASTKLPTTQQQSKTTTNHTRRRGRPSVKNTPVKSQYFADDGEEDKDDESAVEVVQPRRTTARTRKKV